MVFAGAVQDDSQPFSRLEMCSSYLTEIAKVMGEAIHFNTFGGNALGSAVGMAVLDVSFRCIRT